MIDRQVFKRQKLIRQTFVAVVFAAVSCPVLACCGEEPGLLRRGADSGPLTLPRKQAAAVRPAVLREKDPLDPAHAACGEHLQKAFSARQLGCVDQNGGVFAYEHAAAHTAREAQDVIKDFFHRILL